MKIKYTGCEKCHPPDLSEFQFNEDGVYSGPCSNGHDVNFKTSLPLYEILFSIGLQAYKDGYYCETIRAMTASLERFHEYFLKSFILGHTGKIDLMEKSWKEVKNQSERQYGAFVIFFTSMFLEVPPALSENERSFRNNIIHKGNIAKKSETLDYCRKILEIESYCLVKIRSKYLEIEQQYRRHLNNERDKKADPTIAYVNWEPIGHVNSKLNDSAITIERILEKNYVI